MAWIGEGEGDVHVRHAPSNVHFFFNINVLKGLFAKPVLAQRLFTACHWTGGWTTAE